MGNEGTDAPRSASGAVHDGAEIRGRIAVCFSVVELRRFAEELGVPDIPWERGLNDSARDLVRFFERNGQLGMLVERLREARPLLEWPEPGTSSPTSLEQPPYSAALPEPAAAPWPTLAEPVAAPAPEPVPPRPAGFPGNVEPDAPAPPRRVEVRVLLVAFGAVAVAIGIAFAAGRATKPATTAAAASSSAPSAPRPVGPANLAMAAVDRRLDAIARMCDVAPGAADEVMRRVFERCGPAPPETAIQRQPPERSKPPWPATRNPKARPYPAAPRPVVVAGNAACLSSCEQQHRACKVSQCGREPTQGSQYKRYQDCMSTCLQKASKCRLGCP